METHARTTSLDEILSQDRWLRALARRLVRDAATADDLVQETWFRTLRARAASVPRGGGDAARAWLGRVLRNVWHEQGRATRARVQREARTRSPEATPAADEALERLELQRELAGHVLALPEPFRSVLLWRYTEGHSAAAIAEELGEPASRVRWRLMRARELLRERLGRGNRTWDARYAVFLPLARRAGADGAPAGLELPVLLAGAKGWLALAAAVLVAGWALWRVARAPSAPRAPELALAAPELEGSAQREPVAEPTRLPDLAAVRAALATTPPPPPPAARVDAGARLVGTVRAAEDERALAGAEVALFRNGTIRARTASDSAGAFAFTGLEPDGVAVGARLAGRVPSRSRELALGEGTEETIVLELEPGFELAVEVHTRAGGAPLEGAEVRLVPGGRDRVVWLRPEELDFQSALARTGPDGRATLSGLGAGVHQYVVAAEGHATALGETLLEHAAGPLRIELERGAVVFGTVRRPDGAPAEGARVFLNPLGPPPALGEFLFRENGLATDARGAYRLEGVPEGIYNAIALLPNGSGTFALERDGRGERRLARLAVERGSEVPLDFELPPPGRVRGRVLDESGAPLANASISVSWGDFKARGGGFFPIASVPGVKESIHHATKSDADGRFELAPLRLSHEPLELSARRAGYTTAELELDVPAGATLEPVLVLRRLAATVSGRLTDASGAPLAGRTVGAFERAGDGLGAFFQAQSDADGHYALALPATGAASGRYRVYPILREGDARVAEPEAREDVLAGSNGIDFVLHARVHLAGTVEDEEGRPVRDFHVHVLESTPPAAPRWDERDVERGEGRFELHLTPGHDRALRFTAPARDPVTVTDLAPSVERRIVLRRAGDLEGVVRDADGRPVAGAVVALATLDSAVYPSGTQFAPRDTTDADGRFRLLSLPEAPFLDEGAAPGHLLVCPRRADSPALVHFPLPAVRGAPLVLELSRAVEVELEFRSVDGTALTGHALVIDSEGWPLEPTFEAHLADQEDRARGELVDGRARFRLLPGPHQAVLVRGTDVRGAFSFEVAPAAGPTPQRVSFTVGGG
jgi:RNA polymerase sigma-70 factor (ECF subfamily)